MSKIKSRGKRATNHPGEFIGGRAVEKGDVLVRYQDRVVVDVIGFSGKLGQYRTVKLRSRATGKTNVRGADQLRKAFFRAPAGTRAYTKHL